MYISFAVLIVLLVMNFIVIYYISSVVYVVYRLLNGGKTNATYLILTLSMFSICMLVESIVISISFLSASSLGIYSLFIPKLWRLWLMSQIFLSVSGLMATVYVFKRTRGAVAIVPMILLYSVIIIPLILFLISGILAKRTGVNKFSWISIVIGISQIGFLLGFYCYNPWLITIAMGIRDMVLVYLLRT